VNALRGLLALAVVVAMGCALLGIGMGESPAERVPAPSDAEVAASKQRIAAGGPAVQHGRELFADEGCDRCHAIAATGAEGALGPRLDTLDKDFDDNFESITEPRDDIADGFPENLMPTDFASRLGDADVRALAAFVTAASGGEREGEQGGGDGGGRGRGRGRGGGSGEH
jgi:mono/diheme cytochrome c family protein